MSCAQSHDFQMISLPLQDYAATMQVSPPAFSPILSPRRAVAPYQQKPDTGAEPPWYWRFWSTNRSRWEEQFI
jgi:hypothetical protein